MNASPSQVSSILLRRRAAVAFIIAGNLFIASLLMPLPDPGRVAYWFWHITPFSYYADSRWGRVISLPVLLLAIGVLFWMELRQLRAGPEKLQPGKHRWLAAVVPGLLLHAVLWRAHLVPLRLGVLYALVFCSIGWLGGWRLIRRFLLPLTLLAPLFLPQLGAKVDHLQRSLYACFPLQTPERIVRWDLSAEPDSGPVMPIPVSDDTYEFIGKIYSEAPRAGTLLVLVALALRASRPTAQEKRVIWTAGVILALLCAWIGGMGDHC